MCKKGIRIISLLLVVVFLISGCSKQTTEVTDETIIKNQMNKWLKGWENRDTKLFYETMVHEGICFKVEGDFSFEDMTIKEFEEFITMLELWYVPKINSHINNVSINDDKAILNGVWELTVELRRFKIPVEFHFIKSNDTWLITTIVLKEPIIDYEGEEYEDFDPDKHKSYVSFKVDGELYVFHDHYAGVDDEMTLIVTYNNEFQIDVHNYTTGARFILSFEWEGENEGKLDSRSPIEWRPTDDWDDAYEYADSDFVANMEIYDLKGGLVKGTFEGHVYKEEDEQGESVHITEGFFYIEHEFNIPEVTIKKPADGDTVSGIVTVSGTVDDESELIDIDISLYKIKDDIYRERVLNEDLDGTTYWNTTIDTAEYDNGDYILQVFARDEYYNYSRVESIKINIENYIFIFSLLTDYADIKT